MSSKAVWPAWKYYSTLAALTLLVPGVLKVLRPERFVEYLETTGAMAPEFLAYAIIFGEIVLGVVLLLGPFSVGRVAPPLAHWAFMVAGTAGMAALAATWLVSSDQGCGCFGGYIVATRSIRTMVSSALSYLAITGFMNVRG